MTHDDGTAQFGGDEMQDVMGECRRLVSLAYRMTGTLADAEDVVQETYIRWYRMTEDDRASVKNPAAWLTRAASRVALDVLGSARMRREKQVGQWLPEPIPADLFAGTATSPPHGVEDPLDRITLDESVSTALLLVLESMTPPERVAFVLHEVFAVPFTEIAEFVGRSPEATRQLASSARRHIRKKRTTVVPTGEHDAVVRAFLFATQGGDLLHLTQVLAPNVELRADGGGIVSVAPNVVSGANRVARFLLGVMQKQPELTFDERWTADGLGYALTLGRQLFGMASFHVENGRITDVWLVLDPNKLGEWALDEGT